MKNVVDRLTPALIKGFTEKVLLAGYDNPSPVPWCHMDFWEMACSTERYVAVAAPRGHAKSTSITHAYTLANVVFGLHDYVVIISDTEAQAVNFLHDIRMELLENETLIELFGEIEILKDNEKDFIGQFVGGVPFRISARSSLQKLRGLKWMNKRPNLFVGDDMENDEIVLNDERRLKFKRWLFGAVLPAGSRQAKYRFIGTILHMDSFLMSVMPKDDNPLTKHEALKTYSEGLQGGWYSALYRAHTGIGDYTEILWPERFSADDLEREYQSYKIQGLAAQYASEYLNHPIDPTEAYFRETDLKPIREETKKNPPPQTFYMFCDLAISERTQSAWTVLLIAGVDNRNIVRIWDIVRFRGDSRRVIDEMFDLYIKWRCESIFIEKENIANSIGPFLEEEKVKRNLWPDIDTSMVPTKDKIMRSRSIQGRVRQQTVEFDMDAHWWPTFKTELLTFPRSQYMDQVDAFSMVGMKLTTMVPGMVAADEDIYDLDEDDEIDGGWGGFSGYRTQYADKITGY